MAGSSLRPSSSPTNTSCTPVTSTGVRPTYPETISAVSRARCAGEW